MEKKEQNYIRQLLLELEDYLFSLSWYDGEDRLKTFRDLSNIKSIFQLVPKRYLKLLEGKIYTQYELDRAREEVLLELLEKKTNYKIEEVGHGYKVTQEYVLVSDIEKELSKLKSKLTTK
jgi:hypothetical protein